MLTNNVVSFEQPSPGFFECDSIVIVKFGTNVSTSNVQGCHGQGKISGKLNFFQVREKSGNFVDGRGNLERTWKVREKSGNLKVNGYGRRMSENLFILFKRGKMYFLVGKSKPISLLIGVTLKGKNMLPCGANSFL